MLPVVKNLGPPGKGLFTLEVNSNHGRSKKRSRALTHITSRVRCDLSTDTKTLLKLWVPKHRSANKGNRYSHEVLKDLQELLEFRGVGRGITSHGLWGHREWATAPAGTASPLRTVKAYVPMVVIKLMAKFPLVEARCGKNFQIARKIFLDETF